MNNNYPHLFSPLKVGKLTFRNRIVSTPNNTLTDLHDRITFFENKARGGAAVVTVGETAISSKYVTADKGCGFVLDGLDKDHQRLGSFVLAMKAYGAIPNIQLIHHGREYWNHGLQKPPFVDFYPLKPSGYMPIGPTAGVNKDGVEVIEMTEELIEETIQDYANAAQFCKQAGFDMIQIHGGHGWLPAQFASSRTNHRTDRWGGSLENRARFPLEVLKRIREKCGKDLVIEYRVSGDELVENGMRIDETVAFVKLIEPYIDIIHVSAGIHMEMSTERRMFPEGLYEKRGCNVYLAAEIKKHVNIPVLAVGGINTPELAERILAEGKADLVGMGRALIIDPELPNKARAGHPEEIIHCMRCCHCLASTSPWDKAYQLSCSGNPVIGRDRMVARIPEPEGSRKVVVVGGGPAGLYAAMTAAKRGHDVTLFEKSPELGGLMKYADADEAKYEEKLYKDWLVRKTKERVKDIRLGTEATAEIVEPMKADVIIAAVGSKPLIPPIPGVDRETALTVHDVYYSPEKIGDDIIIIGGGQVGCETAIHLGKMGKKVTLIEMTPVLSDPSKNWVQQLSTEEEVYKTKTIDPRLSTKCVKVQGNTVIVEKDGKQEELTGDTVIICAGQTPVTDGLEELRNCADRFVVAGDCIEAQTIGEAVRDGFFNAMNIL
ncbi:FAD-dependent oxidoreductase [bacterium 210820-DFI.6.37]|nr:FAD-dependent oxidoreductase [bacterium 210820-DFI.6.37]